MTQDLYPSIIPPQPWPSASFPPGPIHVMIDLETASTSPNAAILSIGAATFNHPVTQSQATFYGRASLEDNERLGRHVDKETMEWWSKQETQIIQEAFGSSEPLNRLLLNFNNWCSAISGADFERINLWAKSPDFDCVILKNAWEMHNPWPFDFRKYRDMRTVCAMAPGAAVKGVANNVYPHCALADAVAQASICDAVLAMLGQRNIR